MEADKPTTNIYLIGFRCTGKTSVGRALARALDRPFVDADRVLVEEAGATVAEIVERGGWDDFRDREKKVLGRLSSMNGHVIATGGGVVLDAENRAMLRQTGRVVWLRAGVATIRHRMTADHHSEAQRPALTPMGLEAEIRETLAQRDPLYREVADFTVETDRVAIDDIRGIIMTWLGEE
jgi:shikimate kinase